MAWLKKSPDATRGHFLTIQVDLQVYKHYHKFFGEQIFDLVYSALWDLTPLFQLYGGQKTNFLIWTVLGEIITVLTCIWLVRTASSLRLAETNSADTFFFSAVLAQI